MLLDLLICFLLSIQDKLKNDPRKNGRLDSRKIEDWIQDKWKREKEKSQIWYFCSRTHVVDPSHKIARLNKSCSLWLTRFGTPRIFRKRWHVCCVGVYRCTRAHFVGKCVCPGPRPLLFPAVLPRFPIFLLFYHEKQHLNIIVWNLVENDTFISLLFYRAFRFVLLFYHENQNPAVLPRFPIFLLFYHENKNSNFICEKHENMKKTMRLSSCSRCVFIFLLFCRRKRISTKRAATKTQHFKNRFPSVLSHFRFFRNAFRFECVCVPVRQNQNLNFRFPSVFT